MDSAKKTDKGDIAGTISYIDKEFNKFGATQDVVNANFKSLSVQASLFKTNLMSAIGDQPMALYKACHRLFSV